MKKILILLIVFTSLSEAVSQELSSEEMNIGMMVTYGNMGPKSEMEDDHSSTLYVVIPDQFPHSFFIRVFDPDCGGENDFSNGLWETNTEFRFFGGDGCTRLKDNQERDSEASRLNGTLLQKKIFACEPLIDNHWVTFGPFAAEQGERIEKYNGRYFKLTVEGKTGNDGNQYSVVISSSENENLELNGASLYQDRLAFNNDMENRKLRYSITAEPVDE